MKKIIQHSISLIFIILFVNSGCSIPFPIAPDFIMNESTMRNNVNNLIHVGVQNIDRKTKTISVFQLIETEELLVFNEDSIFISGTNQHVKLSLGVNKKWEKRNEVTVTSKAVLDLHFKSKKEAGDTIRIVEKGLNSKGDSIVINIKIPENKEEWDRFYKDDNIENYYRIFDAF